MAVKFKDTYVATHCHGTRAIKESITAGVRTIEHASLIDDEAIEMLKGNTDTYVVPTLSIIMGLVDNVPESSTFMKAKAQRILDAIKVGIRKALILMRHMEHAYLPYKIQYYNHYNERFQHIQICNQLYYQHH